MSVRSPVNRSRGQSIVLGIMVIGSVVLAANLGSAGQAEQGRILGQVTDESGGVLPGVTVTVSSPALQVKQMVGVTDAHGEYRVTPLPLGLYAVEFTLPGFQTLRREDLRLTAAFVAKVDVVLKVGELAQAITVVGQSPVIDVQTTTTATHVTRQLLDSVPTGRDGLVGLMSLAAGVRTDADFGQALSKSPAFRAFGRNNNGWILLDGVPTTAMWPGNSGKNNYIADYEATEEAIVQTMASGAESPTSGIQLSIITKSGGNTFHGGGNLTQFAQWMQSNNIDAALAAQGIEAFQLLERWDRGGQLGGRILRDKLWFYTSARTHKETVPILGLFLPDGSPAANESRPGFTSNKLTARPSPSQRLIGSFQYAQSLRRSDGLNRFTDYNSREYTDKRTSSGKGEWQLARSNKVISAQVGWWDAGGPPKSSFTTAPTAIDQITSRVTGASAQTGAGDNPGRIDLTTTMSWYKPELFRGNHDFKAGFNYDHGYTDDFTVDRGAAGNYQLIFRNGVPFQIAARNNPVNPKNRFHYTAMFLQDSWTVGRRLTLNLGVRYAHDRAFVPEQCRVDAPPPFQTLYPAQCFPYFELNIWNSFVPRLHAAYDLTGDGKTVIKGGWGRFVQLHGIDELGLANKNFDLATTFGWHDLNGDKLFQPGEVNLDPNGPDFVSREVAQNGALVGLIQNANLKQPGSNEFLVSLERELILNFGVRVTGVYSRDFNTRRVENTLRPYSTYNNPITNPDPGPDGRVGTADDPGTFITYYDYPSALRGNAFQRPWFINDPNSDANFKSIEIAANKRLSNRWQLMASYSATKLHVPFIPDISGTRGVSTTTFNPNAEINTANNTWEWLTRIAGSYALPADIQVSANYEIRSGDPWARTVSLTGGQQIPSIRLRVEPIGTRRLDSLHILALRAEKGIRLPGGHRVAVRTQIFNALNINNPEPAGAGTGGVELSSLTTLSGPNFGKVLAIVPPRAAEFAVTYSF